MTYDLDHPCSGLPQLLQVRETPQKSKLNQHFPWLSQGSRFKVSSAPFFTDLVFSRRSEIGAVAKQIVRWVTRRTWLPQRFEPARPRIRKRGHARQRRLSQTHTSYEAPEFGDAMAGTPRRSQKWGKVIVKSPLSEWLLSRGPRLYRKHLGCWQIVFLNTYYREKKSFVFFRPYEMDRCQELACNAPKLFLDSGHCLLLKVVCACVHGDTHAHACAHTRVHSHLSWVAKGRPETTPRTSWL